MKRTYILASSLPSYSTVLEELEGKGYCDETFGQTFAHRNVDKTMIYQIHLELAAKDKIAGASELLQIAKEQNADFILIDFAKRVESFEIEQARLMSLHAATGKFGNESVINLK